MKNIIVILAATALAACMSTVRSVGSDESRAIPTYPGSEITVSSRTGHFTYDGSCLLFRDQLGRFYLPVFVTGSSFDGRVVKSVQRGRIQTLKIGQRLTIGGNVQQWADVPPASSIRNFQASCRATPFLISNIE